MKKIRLLTILLALSLLLQLPALAASDNTEEDALCAAGMAAVNACVDESMTDVEKLTALHDWLALHCDYGDPLNGSLPESALINGLAVCRGYASALAYLYTLAGLDGADTYSEDMDHAWALATLDGERYFSDCTWDDGKDPCLGLIRHKYWLFDEQNAADTYHYGWDSGESVPGGALENAPWGAAVSRVIFFEDYAYYLDGEFRLWRCDRETWDTEELYSLRVRWPDLDEAEAEICSGLVLIDGRLYFNTPYAICSVDLDGNDFKLHLLARTAYPALVYGIGVRDGVICYALADDPDAVKYDVIMTDIPAANAWGY